jgi:hypothetical protein
MPRTIMVLATVLTGLAATVQAQVAQDSQTTAAPPAMATTSQVQLRYQLAWH